jgi:hypothetical protein
MSACLCVCRRALCITTCLVLSVQYVAGRQCSGACINTDNTGCWGTLVHGLCPGPANVVCCEGNVPACNPGVCINVDYQQCSGNLTLHECPGPADIQCCSHGSSKYNPQAAVSWVFDRFPKKPFHLFISWRFVFFFIFLGCIQADKNCASGSSLCAEFVSDALQAGGAGNPRMIWVHEIADWAQASGWKETGGFDLNVFSLLYV